MSIILLLLNAHGKAEGSEEPRGCICGQFSHKRSCLCKGTEAGTVRRQLCLEQRDRKGKQ